MFASTSRADVASVLMTRHRADGGSVEGRYLAWSACGALHVAKQLALHCAAKLGRDNLPSDVPAQDLYGRGIQRADAWTAADHLEVDRAVHFDGWSVAGSDEIVERGAGCNAERRQHCPWVDVGST